MRIAKWTIFAILTAGLSLNFFNFVWSSTMWKILIISINSFYILSVILFIASEARFIPVVLYPSIGKKVKHESGIFHLKYNRLTKEYILYKEYLLFKDKEFDFPSIDRVNESWIIGEIKEYLDEKYKEKLKNINFRKKNLEVLKKWDGCLTLQDKRENKLDKIL
jgi:hypothetical protein